MKRVLAAFLTLLMLLSLLGSCKGGKKPDNGEDDNQANGGEDMDKTENNDIFSMLIGESITLSAVGNDEAKVLCNNSGMSGLWSSNHMHACFDSSKSSSASLIPKNMLLTDEAPTLDFDIGRTECAGKLFIWNYNDISALDSGIKDADILYSTDGEKWTKLGSYVFGMADKDDDEKYGGTVATNTENGMPVDFGGLPVRYIRIAASSNWGGEGFGLSELRLFRHKTRPSKGDMITFEAFTPQTDSNAENVANNTGMDNINDVSTDNGKHTASSADMWLTDASAGDSLLVMNLDGTYPLSVMKLWNYNSADNLGCGIKKFDLYYTTGEACGIVTDTKPNYCDFNKGAWQKLGSYTLPQGTGNDGLEAGLEINLRGIHAQHLKIVPVSNYSGNDKGFGLSEVRIYSADGWAVEPARTWTGLLSSSGSFKYQGNTSKTPYAASNNGTGWIGGDGIFSTSLTDSQGSGSINAESSTLFTFQDSHIGNFANYTAFNMTQGYANSRGFQLGMKNMAYLILKGSVPDPRNAQFYLQLNRGLSSSHPLQNILPGSYWIDDSTVIDGKVYTIANKFSGLTILGMDFYVQSITSDDIVSMNEETELLKTERKEGSYTTLLEQDGYIYQYGRDSAKHLIVRRTTPEKYKSYSGWEYWNGSEWTKSSAEAKAISTVSPSNEFNVTYMESGFFAGKYLAVYTDGSIWGTVTCAVSDSVTGPFKALSDVSNAKSLYWATERYDVSRDSYNTTDTVYQQWNYNAKGQSAISAEGELLITYHFGLHDDRTPSWGFFSAVAKEYEHPTFINLIEIK